MHTSRHALGVCRNPASAGKTKRPAESQGALNTLTQLATVGLAVKLVISNCLRLLKLFSTHCLCGSLHKHQTSLFCNCLLRLFRSVRVEGKGREGRTCGEYRVVEDAMSAKNTLCKNSLGCFLIMKKDCLCKDALQSTPGASCFVCVLFCLCVVLFVCCFVCVLFCRSCCCCCVICTLTA